MRNNFNVTILGCGSPCPLPYRGCTAQLVFNNGYKYLIDCGEGTQIKLREFEIKFGSIDRIFISHDHLDHTAGLGGLLKTIGGNREAPLYIHCPKRIKDCYEVEYYSPVRLDSLSYPVIFQVLEESKSPMLIAEDDRTKIYSFSVHHGTPERPKANCWGFIFEEKLPNDRRVKKGCVVDLGLDGNTCKRLKKGEDLTFELQDCTVTLPNETLTLPPLKPLKYAFVTDTIVHPDVIESVRGCDVLYHDATYLDSEEEDAYANGHSTARQAAEVAVRAEIKDKLILGHFSSRYNMEDLKLFETEAKAVFENTEAAVDGKILTLRRE